MSVTIFHNPSCSKSRASLELVRSQGENAEVKEYLVHPPSIAELRGILTKLGQPAKAILRTGEALFAEHYASLDLDDEDAILKAIVTHPILLERPIVIRGDKAVIGRPPENVAKLWG